jgi:hypothetical protein
VTGSEEAGWGEVIVVEHMTCEKGRRSEDRNMWAVIIIIIMQY